MNSRKYLDSMREVVRNVMDPFVPTVTMSVHYGSEKLINGRELNASITLAAPSVSIGGEVTELYTLVMIDPDAPNPNDPTLQELVTWIVVNIPGRKSCAEGTEIMTYEGPCPQVGIHRYLLVLYKQLSHLDDINMLASRICFSTRDFANKYNLGDPVGIAYFHVRRQSKKRKALI